MVAVVVLALNSFRYAAVIGLVGLASVGLALLGVRLSGYPLGYMALIGTLGLIGLAINGAIIVLSALKANAAACEGDTRASAAVVMDATRHIVSTTVTTIGGFLPLIVSGGHFWPPLAMAIGGRGGLGDPGTLPGAGRVQLLRSPRSATCPERVTGDSRTGVSEVVS
jgi:multidrug efflux pump subunit AcrB